MDLNILLPLASSALSFAMFGLLIDQWRIRRRPFQLVWAIGMLWYGVSAGAEFVGSAIGWSEPLYRAWYLIGAVWVAAWLGLGTVMLLRRTRFGYAMAFSILLAGLFTFLSWRRFDYPASGYAAYVYFAIGIVVAVAITVLTYRGDERWARLVAGVVVVGSLVSAFIAMTVPLAAPGYALDPETGIPTGELFPGYLRLMTPFFNITGAYALIMGALFSAYVFMPKRRVIRYSLDPSQGPRRWLTGLLRGAIGIPVNLAASLPGAATALMRGELNSRVPATIIIAIGALVPAITSGANRFGATSAFFVGEFLGVVFLLLGFLVSVEVFREIRLPFTRIVLWQRRYIGPEA
jgi:hypothetical protein